MLRIPESGFGPRIPPAFFRPISLAHFGNFAQNWPFSPNVLTFPTPKFGVAPFRPHCILCPIPASAPIRPTGTPGTKPNGSLRLSATPNRVCPFSGAHSKKCIQYNRIPNYPKNSYHQWVGQSALITSVQNFWL